MFLAHFATSGVNIYVQNYNKQFPQISNKFQIGCSPHDKLYSFGGTCVLPNITNSGEVYNLLFDFIDTYSKNRKSITDHLIYPYHECLDPVLIQNGYTRARSKKTAIIDIDKPLNEICKGFKKQFSKDIRRSSRNGVTIYESQNYVKDIDLYYNFFQKLLIVRLLNKLIMNIKKYLMLCCHILILKKCVPSFFRRKWQDYFLQNIME